MSGKVKKRIAILIGCAVLAAGMMAVAASMDMPGETVMRWFGAAYDSLSTMVLFVLFCGALVMAVLSMDDLEGWDKR